LPENDGLEYRFCPRCGAEITAPEREIVDNFQTIPPHLNHTVAQRREPAPKPEEVEIHPAPISNQTMEPVIAEKSKARPPIVPPTGPPPSSFYRADPLHPTSGTDNAQDTQVHDNRRPFRLIIIVIGAITILMGGILYVLLV
jgi:hypothetical protein